MLTGSTCPAADGSHERRKPEELARAFAETRCDERSARVAHRREIRALITEAGSRRGGSRDAPRPMAMRNRTADHIRNRFGSLPQSIAFPLLCRPFAPLAKLSDRDALPISRHAGC